MAVSCWRLIAPLPKSTMEHFESGYDNEISESIERQNLRELGLMDDARETYYDTLSASDGHIEPYTNRSEFARGNTELVNDIIKPLLEGHDLTNVTYCC